MNDLFLGKVVSFVVSLILEATSLTELSLLTSLISTFSNPLSTKGVSLPFTLLPVVVLTEAVTDVVDPGVRIS